jgi:hypothetical protein
LKKENIFDGIDWNLLKEEKIVAPYIPDMGGWKGKLPKIA